MSDGHELYAGAYGRKLTRHNSRAGVVDDGNLAWPERIAEAARQWPQAEADNFELVGRRRWRDRATGVEYRQKSGATLLSIGTDANRHVVCFFVDDGRLVFLERADIPEGVYVHHGQVTARQLDIQLAPVVIH